MAVERASQGKWQNTRRPTDDDLSVSQTQSSREAAVVTDEATLEKSPRDLIIGILLTAAGGILWGSNATVSKILLNDYAADPLWIASVRQIFAGILFCACAAFIAPQSLRGAVKDVRGYPYMIMCAVVCVLMTQVTYLSAIDWTNSATATVLQTLSLVFVLIYVCLRGRRLPGGRELIGIALAFAGTVLLATGGDLTTLQLPLPGLLWGLGDAFATAALSIVPTKLIAKWGNFVANGVMFMISGLALLPIVRPWESAPSLDAFGVALMVYTVIGGTFGAYWLYMAGVMRIGSMRATMVGTTEPMMATVTAVWWTGTVFLPTDFVGFAMIIVMVFILR